MAKAAGKSNKSALIRDYLAKKPQASVGDIISKFQERGIKVSAALAAKIKYNPAEKRMRQRKRRSTMTGQRRLGRPPKRRLERGDKAINDSVSLKGLIGAKKLAEKLGGIDVAQQAMSALSKLKAD